MAKLEVRLTYNMKVSEHEGWSQRVKTVNQNCGDCSRIARVLPAAGSTENSLAFSSMEALRQAISSVCAQADRRAPNVYY